MSPVSLRHLPQISGRISATLDSYREDSAKIVEFAPHPEPSLSRAAFSDQVKLFSTIKSNSSQKPKQLEFQLVSTAQSARPSVVQKLTSQQMKELASMSYEERKERIKQILAKHLDASQKEKKPTLLGIIQTESNFNPLALSSDGFESKGLFQLLDKTGLTIKRRLNDQSYYDPWNAEQNVKYGVSYFTYLTDIFRSETTLLNGLKTVPVTDNTELEKFAIAAFNAGEGRVAKAQALAAKNGLDPTVFDNISRYLPEITVDYVKKVLARREKFVNLPDGMNVALQP